MLLSSWSSGLNHNTKFGILHFTGMYMSNKTSFLNTRTIFGYWHLIYERLLYMASKIFYHRA
jgi:hypothetical protein